ncbi:MAG: S-layer homology domain-containing protein [Lysinibacillus sp.]
MKKLLMFPLVLLLLLPFGSFASADDVTGNFHEKSLRYLILKGALTADASGNYYPNQMVTRAEFAHYLSVTLELPEATEPTEFVDVPQNSPYYASIQKAAAAKIITGYEDLTFKPNATISRVHMAVMIERALVHLNVAVDSPTATTFKDQPQILEQYRHAVAVGAHLKIIQGSTEKDGVYFYPNKNANRAQTATFIYRLNEYIGDEDTKFDMYELKTIKNKELVSTGKTSFSYDTLYNQITDHNTQVITLGDKIVYLKAGLGYVVTNKYVALKSETINDQIAVAGGTEMQYLGSDGKNVRVNLAGQVGTLSIDNVSIIPFATSKGRSYYKNEGGELYHFLVDQATGKVTGRYFSGKAPAAMDAGVPYYSWDGIHFAGNGETFTHYNYYQFLPIISKTQYTAEELDSYINYALALREQAGPQYANATKISKLIGLGTTLKQMEEQYGLNAMMILALAFHESDHGMSEHAQKYNNLFGLYVYDTNPLNKEFESVEANILEYINSFIWKNYIPHNGAFANGAVFGSKALGMNVKYASDPYWGAKAAGHYYRADKYLGFKDANNPYTVGLTTTTGLNVRSVPTTAGNSPLYTYTRKNLPLIISNTNLPDWYEIIGEQRGLPTAYVNKQYINIIETTK